MATKKEPTFECAMERLEEVVEALENGELELEKALKLYEEGISLVRVCSTQLETARQRISVLQMQADGNVSAEALDGGEA